MLLVLGMGRDGDTYGGEGGELSGWGREVRGMNDGRSRYFLDSSFDSQSKPSYNPWP